MKIHTQLMFDGQAREAMEFYVGLFPDSKVLDCQLYGEGTLEGKVQLARFALAGTEYACIDSPVPQDFTFTPSMSVFVTFDDAAALEAAFHALADGGEALMPLDNYGFSTRFGWVQDRFGVSWQLNLP